MPDRTLKLLTKDTVVHFFLECGGHKEHQEGLVLHRAAHACNDRSLKIGAGRVAALFGALEDLGKTSQLKDVEALYEQLFHSKMLSILRVTNQLNAMTNWTSGTD